MKVLTKHLVSKKIAADLMEVVGEFINVKVEDAVESYVEPVDGDYDAIGLAAVTILLESLKRELIDVKPPAKGYGVEIRKASA